MYPPYMNNPVNDFYFRNAQPQQQYGQLMLPFPPQNQQQNVPQMPQINSRFVTNIDEAKAAMIDPLSMNLFLDSGNGKIYLKKLGNNGQSEFLCYSIEQLKEEVKADPIIEINSRLSNIEKYLGELKNDKSVSDVIESTRGVATTVTTENESDAETESAGVSKMARNDKWEKRS